MNHKLHLWQSPEFKKTERLSFKNILICLERKKDTELDTTTNFNLWTLEWVSKHLVIDDEGRDLVAYRIYSF